MRPLGIPTIAGRVAQTVVKMVLEPHPVRQESTSRFLHDLVASGTPTIVRPEVMETYEIGWKAEFLDYTLDLGLALFSHEVTDYQDSGIGLLNGVLVFESFNTDVSANPTYS